MTPPPDAFDALVKIGAWALGGLLLFVCSGLVATNRSTKAKQEAFEKMAVEKLHQKDLQITELEWFARWATSKIEAFERDHLPWTYFKQATDSQNKTLNSQTDALIEIKQRLRDLDKSKATKSEMKMLAVRQPEPVRPGDRRHAPPLRRTDGPSTPPPPEPEDEPLWRAKLPSVTTER